MDETPPNGGQHPSGIALRSLPVSPALERRGTDWLGSLWDPVQPPSPPINHSQDTSTLGHGSRSCATASSPALPAPQGQGREEQKTSRNERSVYVTPSENRLVHRKLRGIHLSMIAVNATLGSGLYWRGGEILELGGPLSTLLGFLLPGILSWAVMQCITEMLCIWPIPGALSVYVSEFVDAELGIAVGITYWFTYSASFAALVATSAAEIRFWKLDNNRELDGVVMYLLIPAFLIFLNCFRIEIYGWFEVITSSIKLLFLLVVIAFMVAINLGAGAGAGPEHRVPLNSFWAKPFDYDHKGATSWFNGLAMSIAIASWSYVGVEVVAASALEARWPRPGLGARIRARLSIDADRESNIRQSAGESYLLVGQTVRFAAVYIPVLTTSAYVLASVLASLNISRLDCRLGKQSWVQLDHRCLGDASSNNGGRIVPNSGDHNKTSAFVAIATTSGIPSLDYVFNVFIVFTALTCAGTNLYVASRALFGLTARLDDSESQSRLLRCFAWLGKTNRHRVPMRAIVFSGLSFCWVPFLQLNKDQSSISVFIEVLGTMSTDAIIIVWALECWAFLRFYKCIYKHRGALEAANLSQVRRWDQTHYRDYPYRSHMQPLLGYLALGGCLFVLVVANSSLMWKKFHPTPLLSTFLLQFVFIILYIVLKVFRGGSWTLVDLNKEERVIAKIRKLHSIRQEAADFSP